MSEKDEQASRALAFHHRAEELRAVAEALKDRECHAALLRLAASYEVMARGVEHALEATPGEEVAEQSAPPGGTDVTQAPAKL